MTTTQIDEDLQWMDVEGSTGAEAAEQLTKRKGSKFNRADFFTLQDGDKVLVRFLNDMNPGSGPYIAWLTVKEHFVDTKPKPADFKGDNWPARMSAVCQDDRLFKGKLSPCWICQNVTDSDGKKAFAKARIWALVAMREEVLDEKTGKNLGFRTVMKEITRTVDDKEITEVVPDIRWVKQGRKNFFGILQGTAMRRQTVLDRDYWIQRSGKERDDTEYRFAPEDPYAIEWPVGSGQQASLDLRIPEIMEEYYPKALVPDLLRMAAENASPEHYERFFIPTDDDDKSANAVSAPSNDVTAEQHAAIREKVFEKYVNKDSEDAAAEPKPESPAQKTYYK